MKVGADSIAMSQLNSGREHRISKINQPYQEMNFNVTASPGAEIFHRKGRVPINQF